MSAPVLIIAHGQPSDPGPAAQELALLGRAVAACLPDRTILTATLAEEGALALALSKAGPGTGLVFPLFMSGGWFTRVHLPMRLAKAGGAGWRILEPLGCLPEVQDLALTIHRENPCPHLVLAAHGSGRSLAPSAIAQRLAARMASASGTKVEAAFIDQSPRLADLAPLGPDSLCLPFFAASGGHVTHDLPAALAQSGFAGRILPAIGLDPRLPALIARAIAAARPICLAECRQAGAP